MSWRPEATHSALDLLRSAKDREAPNLAAVVVELNKVMAEMVGPFRTEENLRAATRAIERLKVEVGELPLSSAEKFDPVLIDWLDLATCCWSPNPLRYLHWPAPRAAAAISGKIIRRWTTTGR